MKKNKVVSREEWLSARISLLEKEKAHSRNREALTKERQGLPWVKVDKNYVFEGSDGPISLNDLFGDKSQLTIPIIQDYSGTKRITVVPTLKGSGLTCATIRPGGISWNGLITRITIDSWAGEVGKIPYPYPSGCDEVKFKILPFQRVPLVYVRVVYRDSRYAPITHLVGTFSLERLNIKGVRLSERGPSRRPRSRKRSYIRLYRARRRA